MNGLLLALLLVQAAPQNTGAVTGIVRGANGMPAAGIRVYAMTVRDASEAAIAGTALESIAQTDASGRYRLEVAAGRYFIASGSVGSPTYYPGTTNVAAARVISIAAGGLIESIDFSSFVPASRTPGRPGAPIAPLPPGSTGVLSGTIRFPDGQPATQMTVVAIPAAALAGPGGGPPSGAIGIVSILSSVSAGPGGTNRVTRRVVNGYNTVQAFTDNTGRYRLENMPPETYYIATGYADAPHFFPGTSDILAAKTFVTIPTTLLDTLDFTVAQAMGVSVSGRVSGIGGAPAAGATAHITSLTLYPSSNFVAFGLPSRTLNMSIAVKTDGTFEAPRLSPGDYFLEARALGVRTNTLRITVADQPVNGVDLSIPIAVLSGRILLEDGSALSNPQLFKEAVVTTVINPNLIESTIIPIAGDGTFARFVDANEYRFHLGNLPDEYTIKSVTFGTRDLLKETLVVTRTDPMNIDVRVAMRTEPSSAGNLKVSGSVRDSFTGLPASAERVTLCCLDSGPWERFSTPLRSDGSFEFAGVPRGRYELELQVTTGQPTLFTVNSRVEVADGPASGLSFLSTPELVQVAATIVLEDGSSLPAAVPATVGFTGAMGRVRMIAQRNVDVVSYFVALVPAGDRYNVSVTDLPEGYIVKHISGSIDVPRAPQANPPAPTPAPLQLAPLLITITPPVLQPPR